MSKYDAALAESRRINAIKRMKYQTTIKLSSGKRRAFTNNKAQNDRMKRLNKSYNEAMKKEVIAAKARVYQRNKTGSVSEFTEKSFRDAQAAVKKAHALIIAALEKTPLVETRFSKNEPDGSTKKSVIRLEVRNAKGKHTDLTTDNTSVVIRLLIEVDVGSDFVRQIGDYVTLNVHAVKNMTISEFAAKHYGLMPTDYDIVGFRKTTNQVSQPSKRK